MVRQGVKSSDKTRKTQTIAHGFNTYQNVHVEWIENSSKKQEENTAGMVGDSFDQLRRSNSSFENICNHIQSTMGIVPYSFHIFR